MIISRPEIPIAESSLGNLDRSLYACQIKFDGSYAVFKDGVLYNRHGTPLKKLASKIPVLPDGITGEYIHRKQSPFFGKLIVFDWVHEGYSVEERWGTLERKFGKFVRTSMHDKIVEPTNIENVLLATSYLDIHPALLWNQALSIPDVEGIVLKRRGIRLKSMNPSFGQMKVRKPTKKYLL